MSTWHGIAVVMLVGCEVPTVSLGSRAFLDGSVPDARADARTDEDDDDDEGPDERPCTTARECADDSPFCSARGRCVECLVDDHCRADERCEPDGDCDSPD